MRRTVPLLLAGLLALSGCGGSTPAAKPLIDGLQRFPEEPATRHTVHHVTYDHIPPAGGQHWPASAFGVYGWLRCGVYTEPVPNEFAVHSQEHGAVWLTYTPGASAGDVAKLVTLERGSPYVLVSPYPGQPAPFMASTWGAQLAVQRADDARLAAFVHAYAGGNQGREQGADCIHGTLPAAARAAQARAGG